MVYPDTTPNVTRSTRNPSAIRPEMVRSGKVFTRPERTMSAPVRRPGRRAVLILGEMSARVTGVVSGAPAGPRGALLPPLAPPAKLKTAILGVEPVDSDAKTQQH